MDSLDECCSSIESENLKNINNGGDNREIEQIVNKFKTLRLIKAIPLKSVPRKR